MKNRIKETGLLFIIVSGIILIIKIIITIFTREPMKTELFELNEKIEEIKNWFFKDILGLNI